MNIPYGLERYVHRVIDAVFAKLPQHPPSREQLHQCRIVSHRGEHDNRTVIENTVAALDRAVAAGVWGIEFDVRWTRDLQPVVFHDPDLQRLFASPQPLGLLTLRELQSRFPQIPTLAEVIARFRGKAHLMIEIKAEDYPDPPKQNQILRDLLSGLIPREDFHLISLNPEMFALIDAVPAEACLPVAQLNMHSMSRLALAKGYRGVCGHYFLLTRRLIRRHHAQAQAVGSGFVASKRSLFREINRNVDWIFTNCAVKIQSLCRSA